MEPYAVIYLAGGCFWGAEKYLSEIHGVKETEVGYANGNTEHPTYEQVCHDNTGHAEAVKVHYDPQVLSLAFLLELYYGAINPTSVNRQGGDAGTQYRTGIYYVNREDEPVIRASIEKLQQHCRGAVAIEVKPLENYFPAEEYHQKYLDKNPNGYCHIGQEKFACAAQALVDPARYTAPDPVRMKEKLSPEQYAVTQQNATEPPFQNEFWNHFKSGIYVDVTTGEPLFLSSDQFESGCGWPSFSKPIDRNVAVEKKDLSHGMLRTEVRSRVGNAHLGHVFEDGPRESGGLRYCINSAALSFVPKEQMQAQGYGYLLPFIK
ncbi:peptide-methionine (R)-S-oxide reductase MsrB [Oscillospiraceae bacterium PP1C4]